MRNAYVGIIAILIIFGACILMDWAFKQERKLESGSGGSETTLVTTNATWGPPVLSIEWKAGRIVYAGWVKSEEYPGYMHVVDEKGQRVIRTKSGWTNYGADADVEIGLRSDGVVVWRKAEGAPHE